MTTQQQLLIKKVCALGLLLLWVTGCAVEQGKVHEKGGKKYGVTPEMTWRGRWWDYYQRGSSYAEGKFWQDAIPDFQAAIKQRPQDQRQARTYGLHFLDYFPHRELGIVYYHVKRYPEAIAELEASLRSADTAKAKFYLNKTRKAVLEQTRQDKTPPNIVFDNPADGFLTNRFTIQVTGHAEDDTYVSAVSINGQARFIELAATHMPFDREISLKDGANAIEVTATDLLGRSTHRYITVHVDRQGPLVSVDQVDLVGEPSRQRARVKGFVSDRSRIVRFLLAGSSIPMDQKSEWEFQEDVPLAADAASLPFAVEDAAGNITLGEIALSPSAGRPQGIKQGDFTIPLGTLYASLYPLALTSETIVLSSAILQASQPSDQSPPLIKLPGLAAEQIVYDNTLYLEGQVTDDDTIAAFAINGESLWRRASRQIFFGHFTSLKEGDNRFVLEARDQGGHVARLEILVKYVVPEIKRLNSRLRVVLFPFAKKGQTSALGESVYDSLFNALVNQERFRLVERDQLEKILQELKLSQTELVNPATAAKVGKIEAAEGMLLGTVTETPQALEVFTRFVDVETSVVLAAEDVYGEEKNLRVLGMLMEGLAWKIRQRFPRVEGVILDIEDNVITFDLTSEHGIKEDMKLIIFREGKKLKDPRTGRIRTKPAKLLGEARVETVSDELSEAELLQPEIAGKLRELDKVVTK